MRISVSAPGVFKESFTYRATLVIKTVPQEPAAKWMSKRQSHPGRARGAGVGINPF